jgi:BNR repeat-containing family member
MARSLTTALAVLVVMALSNCTGRIPASDARVVAHCSWSYFGDPRSVAIGSHVFTGCIGVDGRVLVEDLDLETGRRRLDVPFPRLEVDDHNNPSLVEWRGRLLAFSSPHSGYVFPRDRRMSMRYRVLVDVDRGDWGRLRRVPLERGCGLGYTYPNPVVAGDRLYLFMRGPCWEPYFTWTEDGQTWVPPRTLISAPPPSRQDNDSGRQVRPYAKYASGPGGSVLMAFSDGHPASYPSGLYFARLHRNRLIAADGRMLGTLADLPLRFEELDRVAPASAGRAWPMDIAAGKDGAPVIAYTALNADGADFRYAAWWGRWRAHHVVRSGRSASYFASGGASLDHSDPAQMIVSRVIDGEHELELLRTSDGGATWQRQQLTRGSVGFNIRPAIPRGVDGSRPLIVVSVAGSMGGFRDFDTAVQMRLFERSDIQTAWASCPQAPCSAAAGSRTWSAAEAWAWFTALASWISTAWWRSN